MATFFDPELQTMSRAERARLQDERLAELAQRAYDLPIPFWRARLQAAGIGPTELCLANLCEVPPITKDDLREREQLHPPFGDYRGAPRSAWVRLAATSGSTGRPTYVAWTRRDLDVEAAAYARNQWRQGYRPGRTTVVTANPGYLNGGEALTRTCAEAFGALCVSIGPPTDEVELRRAFELLRHLKPNRYVLLGPAHLRVYEAALAAGLDPETDLNLPAPDDNVAFQWRQVSAGMDAMAFLGTECEEHAGAHLNEDFAVVEVLTPGTREKVPAGARGNLVVTTIGRDNVMLRYDTDDVVRVVEDPCRCGETTRRMFFDGRRKDVTIVAGVEVLPIDVDLVLAGDTDLGHPAPTYQIVRRRPDHAVLEIRAEGDGDGKEAECRLSERLGVPVRLEVVRRGSLPRPSYKPERIVDETAAAS